MSKDFLDENDKLADDEILASDEIDVGLEKLAALGGVSESKGFLNEKDKTELINKEKALAIEEAQEKIASFNGQMQNPYPSPFLNLSDMQLPQSTIEVFKWCKYYYTFDPLISGAINALATFPVTEIHLEDEEGKNQEKSEQTKLYEKVLFKNLNIYKLLIEIGIDYFLYGNCFVMGEFNKAEKGEQEWANMTRLDPSKMMIDYNPATGVKKFRWQVPQKIKDIVLKRQPVDEYNKIPQIIKDAVTKNKSIVLNSENVYHFSRATDSMGDNSVWGVPIVANVLKLLMYRNILRQAQEAIAREHIVPMRIYYLDRTQSVNVHADFNKVANDLAEQIKKSVRDPNHKVVSPIPVGVINVGGDGRSLLLTPEIEQIQTEILAGMNVPREFIFGGVSYSGSSISLRILENQFITYRLLLKDFIQNFVIRKMAKARGEWLSENDDENLLTVKLSELKMQDDVQQKQLIIQLNGAGKCSNDYMWKSLGIDSDKMKEAIEKEALDAIKLEAKAEEARLKAQLQNMELQAQIQMKQAQVQMQIQMQQQQIQMQMQMQMQQQQQAMGMQQPTNTKSEDKAKNKDNAQNKSEGDSNHDEQIQKEVDRIAIQLIKLPKDQQQAYLDKIPVEVRNQVQMAMQNLRSAQGGAQPQGESEQTQEAQSQVDMRPLPQQRPPRRDSLK